MAKKKTPTKKSAPKSEPMPDKKAPAPAPKKKVKRRITREPKVDSRKGPAKYAKAKSKSYKRQPTLLG
jgi:hypothetical protein